MIDVQGHVTPADTMIDVFVTVKVMLIQLTLW